MTFATISSLLAIAANLAVIVSLVFVGVQVRMGVRMLRDAAVRNHNEKHQSISKALYENAQLCELWARGGKDGVASLSEGERVQFVNFYSFALRVWEELYLQSRNGVMDSTLWAANIQVLRDAHQLRGAQDVWAIRKHLFTPDFQEFYESYAAAGAPKPLYDLTAGNNGA